MATWLPQLEIQARRRPGRRGGGWGGGGLRPTLPGSLMRGKGGGAVQV